MNESQYLHFSGSEMGWFSGVQQSIGQNPAQSMQRTGCFLSLYILDITYALGTKIPSLFLMYVCSDRSVVMPPSGSTYCLSCLYT